jgi:hypothetical protein
LGFTGLPDANPSVTVPLAIDIIAAGFVVAAYCTFFSMPWHMIRFPIGIGMPTHALQMAHRIGVDDAQRSLPRKRTQHRSCSATFWRKTIGDGRYLIALLQEPSWPFKHNNGDSQFN